MRPIARVGVTAAASRSLLLAACALTLALAPVARTAVPEKRSLSQAIVAYGFLRGDYLDLDKLFASDASLPVVQNLQALDSALKSLDCDVPTRIALPHKALILPSSPMEQWFGFARPGGRNSPDRGWLFVTQSSGTGSGRVLVVLSSASPDRTTVFWLEETGTGYSAKLLYDSLKKGKISNATTMVGAATEVKIEKTGEVLLKDWGEPGVGPREFARVGRIFRLNPSQDTVALVSPGNPVR